MANDNEGIWIIIITILLITFFIIIALIASRISNNATRLATEPGTTPDTGIFLAPCFTDPCNSEFTCDGSFFVCKLPENSPCISYSDCASGLICSGLCVTGATGGLNDFCPCLPNYDCVLQPSGLRVCKGGDGVPCTSDSDCASGVCNSLNQCVGGLPNSYSCTSNGQCASFFCSAGFCQSPEFITGVKGASCAQPCLDIVGAECNEGLLCECVNGINNPGICTTSDSGLLDACAIDSLCSPSLVCYNTTANICSASDPTCTCTFTYDDPNVPDVGTICISGMTENVSQCLNNSGLGCSSGGQCFSTICNGPSKMTVYEFFDQNGVDLGNRFLSAFSTKVTGAFNGPTFESTINPYNMFATSSGDVDTIYVVDYVQGLLRTTYNPRTHVGTSWDQLLPYVMTTMGTDTRTLIDATYNGSLFLVAFHETSGINSNDTVYTFNPETLVLTPFNPLVIGTNILGTQFSNNSPLLINYISVSPANDVSPGNDVLISIDGIVYVKTSTQTQYNIAVISRGPREGQTIINTVGKSQFYYDIEENSSAPGPSICSGNSFTQPIACSSSKNIAFVGPLDSASALLQFSGNIAGIVAPIDPYGNVQYQVMNYSIYSQEGVGMKDSRIIMLTSAYRNTTFIGYIVAVSFSTMLTFLPYQFDSSSVSLATANAFYILSLASCN